eukprot:750006-Hanusia_phi.AAC.2
MGSVVLHVFALDHLFKGYNDMSSPSPSQTRRVMSFEEAMEHAIRHPRKGGCTKYNVELPLEGQSHYKETYQSPSIDFVILLPATILLLSALQIKSAGVPPGIEEFRPRQAQNIPFFGESHSKSTFVAPPQEAYGSPAPAASPDVVRTPARSCLPVRPVSV